MKNFLKASIHPFSTCLFPFRITGILEPFCALFGQIKDYFIDYFIEYLKKPDQMIYEEFTSSFFNLCTTKNQKNKWDQFGGCKVCLLTLTVFSLKTIRA